MYVTEGSSTGIFIICESMYAREYSQDILCKQTTTHRDAHTWQNRKEFEKDILRSVIGVQTGILFSIPSTFYPVHTLHTTLYLEIFVCARLRHVHKHAQRRAPCCPACCVFQHIKKTCGQISGTSVPSTCILLAPQGPDGGEQRTEVRTGRRGGAHRHTSETHSSVQRSRLMPRSGLGGQGLLIS